MCASIQSPEVGYDRRSPCRGRPDVRAARSWSLAGGVVTVAMLVLPVAASARIASSLDDPPYMSSAPSKNVTVLVVINEGGITLHAFRQSGVGSGASLETLTGPVPVGGLVTFNVYNRGKKLHDF